ncbi:MAG: phage GP46 family protein [Desulfovibrionaceae bacterium]
MMRDLLLSWSDLSGDVALSASGTDLATDDSLATAVLVSLFTDRRADDADELPAGETSRRGWWADETLPRLINGTPDRIGSKLWLLRREKALPEVVARARDYAEEALQWLVDEEHCRSVAVEAERQGQDRLALRVIVDGREFSFTLPIGG